MRAVGARRVGYMSGNRALNRSIAQPGYSEGKALTFSFDGTHRELR